MGVPLKTYLTVYFNSDGGKPSEVTEQLLNLGFKPTKGPHDFYYQWGEAQDVNDLIWFADRVHTALQNLSVLYKLETVG